MSFILLEQTFKGVEVGFLAFSGGYKALVLRGSDNFMLVDPKSPEKQVVRGSGINVMKPSGYLHWLIAKSRLI